MGNKEKGANAERELLKIFCENNWRAVRVAGSGLMDDSPCDLLAGKAGERKFCIECKTSKKTSKYISKKQIEDFIIFSEIFGLKPIIAMRFNREGWFFLNPKSLQDSGKNFCITLEDCQKAGKRFGQAFE